MDAAQMIDIHSAKGGESKPKSPTEASDSLRSTRQLQLPRCEVGSALWLGDQTYVPSIPAVENETSLNVEVAQRFSVGAIDHQHSAFRRAHAVRLASPATPG